LGEFSWRTLELTDNPENAMTGVRSEIDEDLNRLAQAVIGAAMEVHTQLGPGYSEVIYAEALEIELKLRNIPYEREAPIFVAYKGQAIGQGRIDFLICGRLILELKVVETILPVHSAQVMTYLKARKLNLGLLLNFHQAHLRNGIKRIILSNP
jgi:GxxExxY protein